MLYPSWARFLHAQCISKVIHLIDSTITILAVLFNLLLLRNYDHHGRPTFADVYRILAEEPEGKLLEVPLVCLENLAHPQQAGRLGASLHTADDLFKEVQNYYYQ